MTHLVVAALPGYIQQLGEGMPAKIIRTEYESLERMAKLFQQQGALIKSVNKKLKQSMQELERGGWIGKGANKFYSEMNSSILPSMTRLSSSLNEAGRTTQTITGIIRQAEEDWKRIFRSDGAGAGAGIGVVTAKPKSGKAAAAGADKLLNKMSKKTRDIVNKSPLLKKQLDSLAKKGWKIKLGPAGQGSSADPKNKIITIDSGESDVERVNTLAHEGGHALYGKVPYHKPTAKMTKAEYVRLNVQEQLKDEGNAQLNTAEVRAEILKAKGPDIGIPGTQTKKYLAVHSQYKAGKITRQQAVNQMANLMGNETTSTTSENYKTYYGKTYRNFWDKKIAPGRRRR